MWARRCARRLREVDPHAEDPIVSLPDEGTIPGRPPDEESEEPLPLDGLLNCSEPEGSAPEDALVCPKRAPPRKDTGPHTQMHNYDQHRQAKLSMDVRGPIWAGGDGVTVRARSAWSAQGGERDEGTGITSEFYGDVVLITGFD